MSRPIIFVVVFFVQSILFGQQQHFDLNWVDIHLYSNTGYASIIPGFDGSHTDYNDTDGLFYVAQWKESLTIDERSAKIVNIKYGDIDRGDLKDLAISLIPKNLQFSIKSSTARGKKSGYVQLSPILQVNGQFKRILSFDVAYTTGTERDFGKKNIQNNALAISNSVLSTGEWFRFYVNKTGIHAITPDFLTSLGMNLPNIDPNTIKIYGNGGQTLPLLNSENTEFDLRENPVVLIGGADGQFSGDDAILFYGESTLGFNPENDSHINVYSDRSYYYVTYGGASSKRVTSMTAPSGVSTLQINTFNSSQYVEEDLYSLARSGRQWYGNKFDIETNKNFSFQFPNIDSSQPVAVIVKAAAQGSTASVMDVLVNNTFQTTLDFPPSSYPRLAREAVFQEDILIDGSVISVSLNYNQNGNPTNAGYLNYIRIEAVSKLIGTGKQMPFQYDAAAIESGVGEYVINNASEIDAVWDVTTPASISSISNTTNLDTFSFKANLGVLKKYVAVVSSDYYAPLAEESTRVSNQNLKGTVFNTAQGDFADIDYLILTNTTLMTAANRLADFHRAKNNMNVKVVSLDMIYTEFSSGKQDISAIRNFVRYVYENASAPENRLKYLCLFGDGSVDYKDRISGNNNSVPLYQTLESLSLSSSFATDDFFVMMDPDEGTINGGGKLDIATGRILADTPTLANAMVDKIVGYQAKDAFGSWRNTHLYIADDVDEYWEKVIQSGLDELANLVDGLVPTSNIKKIYADAFIQETITGGNRYPKVNDALLNTIDSGVLVVNYFGHGGVSGWASESIYDKQSGTELLNKDKYPLFITVTCDFTKFDNPEVKTAGEFTFWNPDGGAVSMITTTRQITVQSGININSTLSGYLFPENEEYLSIAEALAQAKNDISGLSTRVVFMIGDPAMRLAIPKRAVQLTKINDVAITAATVDTLKALGRVKFSGEVLKSGVVDTGYNGVLSTTIYDKKISKTTLANDQTTEDPGGEGAIVKLTFEELGGVIFKGKASVKEGKFDFEFVVPKDVLIPVGTGRVSFYAEKDDAEEDQSGRDETILIGGINENAPEDAMGPEVKLFLNDENFVSGGVVNNSPVLIAKLQDENGINTSSGIGHDILAVIDGDETNPIVLNDFYETDLDDFTKGSLSFKLRDLEPGSHTLTLRAWDVYNNSTTRELQFIILEDEVFKIENVLNYPNPFVSYTEFWFNHNNPVEAILDVQIQVFTVTGKVIWTTSKTVSGKRSYQNEMVWDGRDDFGDRVGKGVYVYKISVKSTLTNKTVEKIEKLVVL